MSEAEVKTNPPAATAAPAKKDPHAEAKRQKVVSPEYLFHEAPRTKEFITGDRKSVV